MKEKSVVKDGPSSTIMPVATITSPAAADRQQKTEELISLVKGRSARSLKAFLDSEAKDIDLMKVEDERGYTLLHLAAFKKFSNDFELIILQYANMQNGNDEKKLKDYIN